MKEREVIQDGLTELNDAWLSHWAAREIYQPFTSEPPLFPVEEMRVFTESNAVMPGCNVQFSDEVSTRMLALCQRRSCIPADFFTLVALGLQRLYKTQLQTGGTETLTFSAGLNALRQGIWDQWQAIQTLSADDQSRPKDSLIQQYFHFDCGALLSAEFRVGQFTLSVTSKTQFDAECMLENAVYLVRVLLDFPEQNIEPLIAIAPSQHQWLTALNQTSQPVPDLNIAQQIVLMAQTQGEKIALIMGDQQMTYRELLQRAEALAVLIQQMVDTSEANIVIYLDRGFDALTAILAVMKSGLAFVPVDPAFSSRRSDFIVADCNPALVITDSELADNLAVPPGVDTVLMDKLSLPFEYHSNPGVADTHPDQLAYILYTSGSTGNPKGVQVTHRGVTNLVAAMSHAWQISASTRYLQFASMSFDASIPEWATTLSQGGTVIFKPARDLGLNDELLDVIEQQRISVIKMPAAALATLPWRQLPDLDVVITAGDACNQDLVRRWAKKDNQGNRRLFFNCYGPTEMSIGTTMYPCDPADQHPCIGRPNFNTQVYILDEALNLLPPGVQGELYLTGEGVTRGYNHQPARTAENWLPNPFADDGSRLYKSGDVGWYRNDGRIEFAGRVDDQIKISGFRVEPGEIEKVLNNHEQIEQSCVIAIEPAAAGAKQLVAYFQLVDSATLTIAQLREWLQPQLPAYMIPALFQQVKSFVLTTNGKIDKKQLPPITAFNTDEAFAGFATDKQQQVALIWQQFLGGRLPGPDDNFFLLGGSSLSGSGICQHLSQQTGQRISLATLMQFPVLQEFVSRITQLSESQSEHEGIANITIDVVDGDWFDTSFAQQRLWYMQQLQPDSPFYNICFNLTFRRNVQPENLQVVLQWLVDHHPSLRTCYRQQQGKLQQKIVHIDVRLTQEVVTESTLKQKITQHARTSLNLSNGQNCAFSLFTAGKHQTLSVAIHHIATDGYGIGVFCQQLSDLLKIDDDSSGTFATDKVLIKDTVNPTVFWLEQEASLARSSQWQASLNWWNLQLTHHHDTLNLVDEIAPTQQASYEGAQLNFVIGSSHRRGLQQLASEHSVTLYALLVAGLAISLSPWMEQDELAVGVTLAPERPTALNQHMGLFVNTLPVFLSPDANQSTYQFLSDVMQSLIDVRLHQSIPLQQVARLQSGDESLFQVLFAYQQIDRKHNKVFDFNYSSNKTAKYKLTLLTDDDGDQLNCRLEYDTGLFSSVIPTAIQQQFTQIIAHFCRVKSETFASTNTGDWLTRDSLLSEPVVERLPTIDTRIERVAILSPDAVALVWNQDGRKQQLSYQMLIKTADYLAMLLEQRGASTGKIVALALYQDDPLFVLLQLACLKLGCPILAISEHYPAERVSLMLDHAEPVLVITESMENEQLFDYAARATSHSSIVLAEQLDWQNDAATAAFSYHGQLSDVAYVVFTSGTTGTPKGIEVRHKTLANLIDWQCRQPGDSSIAHVLQCSAPGFDVSLQELFFCWANGSSYHLADKQMRYDFAALTAFSQQYPLSQLFMPTALFHQYASYLTETHQDCLYSQITVAGEQLTLAPDVCDELARKHQFTLINHYGPAETHVVTSAVIDWENPDFHIGRPVAGCSVLVLDQQQKIQPVGVAGELYIAGAHLAKGYLHDPVRTARRFISLHGQRMYATGDLARVRPDGNIDFIGRVDDQIKIRGMRVEPGEVARYIESSPLVKQAFVAGMHNHQTEVALACWIQWNNGVTCDDPLAELKRQMKHQLPKYMLPDSWNVVPAFGFTAHGKVDRQALTPPQWTESGDQMSEPLQDLLEELIAEIWSEILALPVDNRLMDFMNAGGHSLKLIQLSTDYLSVFELEFPVAELLEHTLLHEQRDYLNRKAMAQGRDLMQEFEDLANA